MKEGDFLLCKNSYYSWNEIGDTVKIKINNLFKEPKLKKGQRYRIDKIDKNFRGISGTCGTAGISGSAGISGTSWQSQGSSGISTSTTTSTTTTTITTTPTANMVYYDYIYTINGLDFYDNGKMFEVFYTQKEERCIKLKKLNLASEV